MQLWLSKTCTFWLLLNRSAFKDLTGCPGTVDKEAFFDLNFRPVLQCASGEATSGQGATAPWEPKRSSYRPAGQAMQLGSVPPGKGLRAGRGRLAWRSFDREITQSELHCSAVSLLFHQLSCLSSLSWLTIITGTQSLRPAEPYFKSKCRHFSSLHHRCTNWQRLFFIGQFHSGCRCHEHNAGKQ